jgi:hypothetical protein
MWHSGKFDLCIPAESSDSIYRCQWRQQVEVSRIVAEIDAQILKLQQARALLAGVAVPAARAGRGRPKGSKNGSTVAAAAPAGTRKRKLSPEGRKRIAEAMKKRWAERRKQNAKG